VLAELVRGADTRPLYLSPRLVRREVCVPIPLRTGECLTRAEWFLPGAEPVDNSTAAAPPIRLRQPTPGLKLAYDPRLPPESQVFELALQGVAAGDRVSWVIDGDERPETGATLRWTVARGEHRVAAAVRRGGALIAQVGEVAFTVK
jgi:penicillin-binding protein 1C